MNSTLTMEKLLIGLLLFIIVVLSFILNDLWKTNTETQHASQPQSATDPRNKLALLTASVRPSSGTVATNLQKQTPLFEKPQKRRGVQLSSHISTPIRSSNPMKEDAKSENMRSVVEPRLFEGFTGNDLEKHSEQKKLTSTIVSSENHPNMPVTKDLILEDSMKKFISARQAGLDSEKILPGTKSGDEGRKNDGNSKVTELRNNVAAMNRLINAQERRKASQKAVEIHEDLTQSGDVHNDNETNKVVSEANQV